ncbi:MAG: TlyA family rRNA (cytidine-2'-O)-methyltransferase [Candidatus Binatia bacterium]|nr:MAG: TlyA family rRNA (cytidine-2'-O)-methyltransferase [Candidatus Binatia bacterium]
MGAPKERLDRLLVLRGLAPNRERAQRLVRAGRVRVAGRVVDKPGTLVPSDAPLEAEEPSPYVSRGGEKLAAALDHWGIGVEGRSCLDVGASTGGFTDCLLRRGAARVVAVDVGYGQFAWKLRQDPRVVLFERKNARHLRPEDLPFAPDLAAIDVSFISLRLVLPVVAGLLRPGAEILALVKPQFEVGKGEVGKGGVVRDEEKIRRAVEGVAEFARDSGLRVLGSFESPLRGPRGNREFFLWLRRSLFEGPPDDELPVEVGGEPEGPETEAL